MTRFLQDEETQKKGVVMVIYACYTEESSRKRTRPGIQAFMKIGKLNRAMPMKVRGRHLCTSGKLPGIVFSHGLSFMEKEDRMRSRVHYGTGWQTPLLLQLGFFSRSAMELL
jgi:hypothetical protein